MSDSTLPRVPRLPAEFIPLIEPLIGRPKGWRPKRLSPAKLHSIREQLLWVADEFGEGSPVYNRALLVTALEYARAEMVP